MDLNPWNNALAPFHPGAVETEFSEVRFKGDTEKPLLHKGFEPLHPEDIADIIHFVVSRPVPCKYC
jgi:NADP-dependent 3-hydroxy acid dehydrogenase YdfG